MRKLLLYISLILLTGGLFAQNSQTTFGKNRVQYKRFNWKYISTKHFYIYYYFAGAEIAHNAGRIAEKEYENLLSLTGVNPRDKITLILYNSVEDMQQSNIGLHGFEKLGGQTELYKTKAEIAFPGNMVDYKEEIRKSIARMLVQVYLYGGSLKEVVQGTYLLTLPDWYLSGVSSYIGMGWSPEMNDKIRSLLKRKKGIKNPDFSEKEEAEVIGHSIFSYIAQEFGPNNVSNVISLTKAFRKVDLAISGALGISYEDFLHGWRRFYLGGEEGTENPQEFLVSKKKRRVYSDVAFNPSGEYVAYSVNKNGKYKVYVYNLVTEEKEKVFKGGQRLVNQEVNMEYPKLAWQNNDMLSIIYSHKGTVKLKAVDIVGDADFEDQFERFEQVLSFDFSKNGRNIIFSGVQKGSSDIFLYDIFSKQLDNITNDLYDDIDPVYTADGGVLFSSNRFNDTLGVDFGKFDRIVDQYDLFYMPPPDSGVAVLENLTNDAYRKISKIERINDEEYLMLVENFKRKQLYTFSLKTNEMVKVTDFDQNILEYDYSKNGAFTFIQYDEGHQQRFLTKQYPLEPKAEGKIEKVFLPENVKEFLNPSEFDVYDIPKVYKTDIKNLDIEDYVFESDTAKLKSLQLQKQKDDFEDQVFILGPYSYKKLFGINNVATSLKVDQLRGLGILLDFGMSDLMEDYRVNASIFGLSDLRSSSLFAEYKNLKNKRDLTYWFERETFFILQDTYLQDYVLNTLGFRIDQPFSYSTRVGVMAAYNNTRYGEFRLTFPLQEEDVVQNYLQLGTDFVFDNTIVQGENMLEGSRMKAGFHQFFHRDSEFRFSRVDIDIRNYQKIHKQMVFATRVAYGRFLGNAKKNYFLGGMDSWLFDDTNTSGNDNPMFVEQGRDQSSILLSEFATNVRGFDYNERYGNNFFLLNAEYRLPIAKYIYPGPIGSQFLSNLQLITFFDMGTAWDGNSLFFSSTDVNTNEVTSDETNLEGDPTPSFIAQVKDYSDPFIYGYGGGIRSRVLGYYMKLDVAWGIENGVSRKTPRFYFTVGYDF